jgi:tetratricopeptide (TPR) repeat protein
MARCHALYRQIGDHVLNPIVANPPPKPPHQTPPGAAGQVAASLADSLRLPDPRRARPAPPVIAAPGKPAAASAPAIPAGPPEWLLDLGLTCAAMGAIPRALAALRVVTAQRPQWRTAWDALAKLLILTDDAAAAIAARQAGLAATQPGPPPAKSMPPAKIAQSEQQLRVMLRDSPQPAIALLRGYLVQNPTNPAALRLLAERFLADRNPDCAEACLDRAVALAPSYQGARHDYLVLLAARFHWLEAQTQIDYLLTQDPANAYYLTVRAELFTARADAPRAVAAFEALLATRAPQNPRFWLAYGNALRDCARRDDALRAYRTAIAAAPAMGEAYYAITNLKSVTVTGEDIAAMQAQLRATRLTATDRLHLQYALGQALEKTGDYGESFAHYAAGAAIRRDNLGPSEPTYKADDLTRQVSKSKAFFTASLCTTRVARPHPTTSPIFIVGMPRSGSTLLEQILTSHTDVEATQELPELPNLINTLHVERGGTYPNCLRALSSEELSELGARYIDAARVWRQTDKPFFIDKMPANWLNIGFIHMILPHAKIIDARRHPMAAGFGTFKQLIIGGSNYSYDLTDIGRRYRDYVDLMAHFDAALPGRVHRQLYEDMVEDTEAQIRALLAHCGLDFQPACLRFWETDRSIRTPSSEQVRQPIYRGGLDQWRNYEPWLDPLKAALGPALTGYKS